MSNKKDKSDLEKKLDALGIKYKPSVLPNLLDTKDKFYIAAGYVCYRENQYWFCFIGGAHGGPMIVKKITESEYFDVRSGVLSSSELSKRYPECYGDAFESDLVIKRWIDKGVFN